MNEKLGIENENEKIKEKELNNKKIYEPFFRIIYQSADTNESYEVLISQKIYSLKDIFFGIANYDEIEFTNGETLSFQDLMHNNFNDCHFLMVSDYHDSFFDLIADRDLIKISHNGQKDIILQVFYIDEKWKVYSGEYYICELKELNYKRKEITIVGNMLVEDLRKKRKEYLNLKNNETKVYEDLTKEEKEKYFNATLETIRKSMPDLFDENGLIKINKLKEFDF